MGEDSAWKCGLGDSKSSPCRWSTKSVFLSSASPFFPSWGRNQGHCPQSSCLFLSRRCPRAALNMVFRAWFWELEDPAVPARCLWGGGEDNKVAFIWPQNPFLVPPASSSHCLVLTAQHGDSRSSQIVLCQQRTNWDYYLLALTCQGSCLTQALIIVIIYFLPDALRARSRAVSLGAAPVKHKDLCRTHGAGVQLGQQEEGWWVTRFMVLLRYICSSFSPIQKKSGTCLCFT